ncbi:MAG TPA: hypothetical protein VH353_09260 [Caulobacteraceae bacterium]|nr:hypothetical protein [Caulobacteraceae bacterium]
MLDYDQVVRTRTLARAVGPYLVVIAVALFARWGTLPILLPAFMQDAPLIFAAGAFTLMAGLAIISAHHHWTGASAIVISLIGVLAALKGAALMISPTLGAELTAVATRTPALLMVVAVVLLLVGLWLSFVGWRKA